MAAIVTAIILFIVSIMAFPISVRSFKEKGVLFNNAYLYATKQERVYMDKKPHYRQSAIIFLLIGIIFLLNAVEALLNTGWIFYMVIAIIIIMIIYAIVSSMMMKSKK